MVNVQIEMFNVGEDAYFVFGISPHPRSENNIYDATELVDACSFPLCRWYYRNRKA